MSLISLLFNSRGPARLLAGALLSASLLLGVSVQAEEKLFLETDDGEIVIKLRPDLAPKHVARITKLANDGFYNGLTFHRVIDGFMAQGGDPKGDGTGGSGQKLPAEFSEAPFKRGTVAMARAGHDVNSGDSQFFICLAAAPHLGGQYTVWGEVEDGMDVVDKIKKGNPARNGAVSEPTKIKTARVK
ncbi:MAG: peptidylprolyl isomerase [Verrucomicrobiota bacterium]